MCEYLRKNQVFAEKLQKKPQFDIGQVSTLHLIFLDQVFPFSSRTPFEYFSYQLKTHTNKTAFKDHVYMSLDKV